MSEGVLVVDKPGGMTSTDVLRRLRKPLGTRKLGHAGTLDPMATGILVVGVNAATRLVPWLMAGRKRYVAEVLLGTRTTTDDIEGDVVERTPVPDYPDATIREALDRYIGTMEQIPPAYSAIHVDGERAYRLARRGVTPELAARRVSIHDLRLLRREDERIVLDCDVGKGTYIRALARDIGEHLGCGGTLSSLRRTEAWPFTEVEAVPLDVLLAGEDPPPLVPMWDALPMLPSLVLESEEARALAMGQRRRVLASRIMAPERPSCLGAVAGAAETGSAAQPGAEPPGVAEGSAVRIRLAQTGLVAIATVERTEVDEGAVVLKPLRVFRRPEELPSP